MRFRGRARRCRRFSRDRVVGTTSPYPTVVIVWSAHHAASPQSWESRALSTIRMRIAPANASPRNVPARPSVSERALTIRRARRSTRAGRSPSQVSARCQSSVGARRLGRRRLRLDDPCTARRSARIRALEARSRGRRSLSFRTESAAARLRSWRFGSSRSTGRRPRIVSRVRASRSCSFTVSPVRGAGGGRCSNR